MGTTTPAVSASEHEQTWVERFVNYDDGKADQKDTLFAGVGGLQTDLAIHAFSFGPDGKFYFNYGNTGGQLMDRHGKPRLN